jgi:hypothetical protein
MRTLFQIVIVTLTLLLSQNVGTGFSFTHIDLSNKRVSVEKRIFLAHLFFFFCYILALLLEQMKTHKMKTKE